MQNKPIAETPLPPRRGSGRFAAILGFFAVLGPFLGAVSSVAVGLVVALRDRRHGRISWRAALIGALVVWLVMAAFAALVIPPDGFLLWLVGLLVAHVVAAVLCTAIARLVLGNRVPAGGRGA